MTLLVGEKPAIRLAPLVYGYDVRLSSEWNQFESGMERHFEVSNALGYERNLQASEY